MLPVLLGLGGFYYLYHRAHKSSAKKPVPPPVARAHGVLMQCEYQPDKLDHAAQAFGSEGFPQLARELRGKAQQVRQQAAAVPSIVERSRAGDQNALAMITACRENAAAGSPRAQVTCALIEQYCNAHPAPPRPGEVQDTPQANAAAA
jgi:hypothetical protein